MDVYNSQRVGAATVALGIADGAYRRALAYVGSASSSGARSPSFRGYNGFSRT